MVETRCINQNNLAAVMLDSKVLHSRRAWVQIIANFGQSFAGCRVDKLDLGFNTVSLHK